MRKNYALFWLAASLIFALDRVTKVWAESTLSLGESVPGIRDWYEWTLYHNTGAAGGVLSGHVELLIFISVIAIAGILWFVHRGDHDANVWLLTGLGLMIGGALGNLFDRVCYHYVIDFIDPVSRDYIYNIADKGIRWGLYLGIFGLWRSRRRYIKEERQKEQKAVS